MVKIKKKKFWYLSFSCLAISLWSTSLSDNAGSTTFTCKLLNLTNPSLPILRGKMLSPHYFKTVVITTEQDHPGEKGICLRFQYTSNQPYGEDTETVSWGWFFFPGNQTQTWNLKGNPKCEFYSLVPLQSNYLFQNVHRKCHKVSEIFCIPSFGLPKKGFPGFSLRYRKIALMLGEWEAWLRRDWVCILLCCKSVGEVWLKCSLRLPIPLFLFTGHRRSMWLF